MRYPMLIAAGALVAAVAATAHAESPRLSYSAVQPTLVAFNPVPETRNNAAALHTLLEQWDRAGFTPPSKPTNGPTYNAMVSLIRSALSNAQQGHDDEAAAQIAKANALLASAGPSTPVHVAERN